MHVVSLSACTLAGLAGTWSPGAVFCRMFRFVLFFTCLLFHIIMRLMQCNEFAAGCVFIV